MKNPHEVLRQKEQELSRVRTEVEALRVAARLLEHDGGRSSGNGKEDGRQIIEMP